LVFKLLHGDVKPPIQKLAEGRLQVIKLPAADTAKPGIITISKRLVLGALVGQDEAREHDPMETPRVQDSWSFEIEAPHQCRGQEKLTSTASRAALKHA
jgi:hypothetical protein